MPVRNAAMRSGAATFAGVPAGAMSSIFAIAIPCMMLFGEFERAGVDFAAGPAGQLDRLRDRILDAVALQGRAQQFVELGLRHDLRVRSRRTNHHNELT